MTNFERKKKNGALDALRGHRTRTLAGILVNIGRQFAVASLRLFRPFTQVGSSPPSGLALARLQGNLPPASLILGGHLHVATAEQPIDDDEVARLDLGAARAVAIDLRN
jgi:hypothetical protein